MAPSIPTAHTPQAFVGHCTTLFSPGWDVCGNRPAQGWGIVKGNFVFSILKDMHQPRSLFILNFLSAPNIKNIKTELKNRV